MTTVAPPNLVALRLNKGLSIRAAADKMGIAEQSLRRAEGGESVLPRVAYQIATFYGYRVTDVWPLDTNGAAA